MRQYDRWTFDIIINIFNRRYSTGMEKNLSHKLKASLQLIRGKIAKEVLLREHQRMEKEIFFRYEGVLAERMFVGTRG